METITGNDGKQEGEMARRAKKRMGENEREKGENKTGT
jgi:hypothetical protein